MAETPEPAHEDGRAMCFAQGKPCTYESDTDPDSIITEWPNGVVDRMNIPTNQVTRQRPDGSTESFAADDAEARRPPVIP